MDAENEERIKQLVHEKYQLQTKLVSTKSKDNKSIYYRLNW